MTTRILHVLLSIYLLLQSFCSFAQAPAQFNFQGIARGVYGAPLQSKNIALRFSIRAGAPGGSIVYRESRSVLTDSTGVFNAVIGGLGATNVTGRLDTITWNAGSKFLQVELDEYNGTSYIDLGATQLLSVPFAMYSNRASTADSTVYAKSSGAYFFEAKFPSGANPIPIGANKTLIFPYTNYNYLNSTTGKPVYDSTNGEFTAPETGIYQFDVELFTYSDGPIDENTDIDVLLTRNGQNVRLKGHQDGPYQTRLLLTAGDIIKVSYYTNRSSSAVVTDGNLEYSVVTNYFSGYKIK